MGRRGLRGEGERLRVELVADEPLHFRHEGFEVAAFFAAHAGEFLEQDVEVLFSLEEGGGGVARGAFEDVGEAASYVGEFLFLMHADRSVIALVVCGFGVCVAYHSNAMRIQR